MNTNIKATHIVLTEAISDYVDKRFQSVKKLLENDPTVKMDIELSRTTQHHKNGEIFRADVHIVGNHLDAYASAEKTDLYAAIDVLRDEITQRITATKGKRIAAVRKGGAKVKNIIKQFFGQSEE
ncbi:MAG: ribosome hibernation promoting factor [Candidatus Taylorbacteria bacterium]|nr:ribosome hibernation promoting factor [Candidatus Taylorbacteria bacterium]